MRFVTLGNEKAVLRYGGASGPGQCAPWRARRPPSDRAAPQVDARPPGSRRRRRTALGPGSPGQRPGVRGRDALSRGVDHLARSRRRHRVREPGPARGRHACVMRPCVGSCPCRHRPRGRIHIHSRVRPQSSVQRRQAATGLQGISRARCGGLHQGDDMPIVMHRARTELRVECPTEPPWIGGARCAFRPQDTTQRGLELPARCCSVTRPTIVDARRRSCRLLSRPRQDRRASCPCAHPPADPPGQKLGLLLKLTTAFTQALVQPDTESLTRYLTVSVKGPSLAG